ncbi:MAG TPA: hypothetical protein VL463_27140 [Kofleriaceae bacterium]|jgi:hypothetical protein|nr:hypothetical protein [Kofleriaceae bacterium]
MAKLGPVRSLLAKLLGLSREEEKVRESAERSATIGLRTAIGTSIGLTAGLLAGVLTGNPEIAVSVTAIVTPPAALAGRSAGMRAWDKRRRQLAASGDPINRAQLARDEYAERLGDIKQLHSLTDADRRQLERKAYERLEQLLAADQQRERLLLIVPDSPPRLTIDRHGAPIALLSGDPDRDGD